MVSRPSAAVAEIVVRTIRRASYAGPGRPRCMVARLSHMTTSPLRQLAGSSCPAPWRRPSARRSAFSLAPAPCLRSRRRARPGRALRGRSTDFSRPCASTAAAAPRAPRGWRGRARSGRGNARSHARRRSFELPAQSGLKTPKARRVDTNSVSPPFAGMMCAESTDVKCGHSFERAVGMPRLVCPVAQGEPMIGRHDLAVGADRAEGHKMSAGTQRADLGHLGRTEAPREWRAAARRSLPGRERQGRNALRMPPRRRVRGVVRRDLGDRHAAQFCGESPGRAGWRPSAHSPGPHFRPTFSQSRPAGKESKARCELRALQRQGLDLKACTH